MTLRFRLPALFAATLLAIASAAHAQSTDVDPRPNAVPADPKTDGADASSADSQLTPDLFYRLMLGDVALQRGDVGLAARAYIDAARASGDSRLARRATEIAIASRQRALVSDAAQLWSKLDPTAERPKRVLAALAADGGKGVPNSAADDELRARIEKVLADAALSGSGVGEVFMQLNRLFAEQSDKRAVLSLVRDVAKPYPKTPEAHYAVALAAYAAGDDMATASEASEEVDRALELRPDWERAAILKSEILGSQVDGLGDQWLETFVAAQPNAKSAIGALAQQYVEREALRRSARADAEAVGSRAGVARSRIRRRSDRAADEGLCRSRAFAARSQAARIMASRARSTCTSRKSRRTRSNTTRRSSATRRSPRASARGSRSFESVRCTASRARSPRRSAVRGLPPSRRNRRSRCGRRRRNCCATRATMPVRIACSTKGLDDNPDTPDLIYDLAMVAEKLDKVDEAESRLKRLVELKPDDAQALNALGYTLVDRTPRTDEGLALIERAHKLSPKDPFILDSLGWAFYRMGRLDEAERYLQARRSRAVPTRKSPRISARCSGARASAIRRVRCGRRNSIPILKTRY